MIIVGARRWVGAEPARVYAFLSDLPNHRRLTGPRLRLVRLRPDRLGARIELRGPLLLRRRVRTTVLVADPPYHWGGLANLTGGTSASVDWRLTPHDGGTDVRLTARIHPVGTPDRLLLALGGDRWLTGAFRQTLALLAHSLPEG